MLKLYIFLIWNYRLTGAVLHVHPLFWHYNIDMTSIQVENVPGDVHKVLRRRAAGAGQSLQEYLLHLLCEQARNPILEEVMARAGSRVGGNIGTYEAVAAVRAQRDSR